MQKLLLILLSVPLAAFGSTVYTFSENVANLGTVGFTYTAPDYLTQSTNYVNSWRFTSCDTSAMPGWICTDAYLKQTSADITGNPNVQVSLSLVYLPNPNDAFSTDEINEGFPGANLITDGTYQAFLSDATLTVHDPPDPAIPEPRTWGLMGLAGTILILLGARSRKAVVVLARPATEVLPE